MAGVLVGARVGDGGGVIGVDGGAGVIFICTLAPVPQEDSSIQIANIKIDRRMMEKYIHKHKLALSFMLNLRA